METIIFNNKNALEDFGIWIAKEYELPFVEEEIEEIEVEGRSGTLIRRTGKYKDLSITLELTATDITDYRPLIRKINKWLSEVEDDKLIFTSYRERHFKVKKITIGNIARDIARCGNFTVTFLCKPFYYSNSERWETVKTNSIVYNDGDIASQPNLLLEGVSGNISIRINGKETQFKGVTGAISINSELFRATDGNGQSVTNKMVGDFPILDTGKNTITYTGTIKTFKIIKNTIYKG